MNCSQSWPRPFTRPGDEARSLNPGYGKRHVVPARDTLVTPLVMTTSESRLQDRLTENRLGSKS
jgi:hypothetical protein